MSLVKCPECGKELLNNVSVCPECGYVIKKAIVQKGFICRRQIVFIIIGILCLIIGFKMITSKQYSHYKENYSYYEEQYIETTMLAESYGYSGTLGSGYEYLSESWKGMKEEAWRYLLFCKVGAIALAGIGVVMIIKGTRK